MLNPRSGCARSLKSLTRSIALFRASLNHQARVSHRLSPLFQLQRFSEHLRRLSRSPQESFPHVVVSLYISGVLKGAASIAAADILDADDAAARGRFCGATMTLKLESTEEEQTETEGGREPVAQVFFFRVIAETGDCVFF